MWYCHECGAEMRPLMVPDPHCASCNGTFVETIESPQDDPRAWQNIGPGDDGDFDDFPVQFRDLFRSARPGGNGTGFTLSINRSLPPSGNTRTFILGPGRTDMGPDRVMPLTEFLAETTGDRPGRTTRDGGTPAPHLMINHILGMLAQRHADQRGLGEPNPFADMLNMRRGGPEGGRLGDYVLNQQALDQIMTALMENSNAHRPVPATEQVLEQLDYDVLEEGSPLLEKDCAICKDQFSLQTEDPDEQVVITLPCKHPFHSPCILPWLKQNGTCPTCRHQLVPQPGSASNPNVNSGNASGPSTQPAPSPDPWTQPRAGTSSHYPASSRDRGRTDSPESNDGGGGGFLGMVGNLLHSWAGGHSNPGPVPSGSGPGPETLPGGWGSDLSPRPESGSRSSHTRNQPPRQFDGTYSSFGRRSQPNPLSDRAGSPRGPNSDANSGSRDRNRDTTNERSSHNSGSYRRGGNDRERQRQRQRDRDGQRRNTQSWENPELD